MGATHYTHWFQPMTQYHRRANTTPSSPPPTTDGSWSFREKPGQGRTGRFFLPLWWAAGHLEARGYTAWDPTSPAFCQDGTLYIPTAFCSYTGEALDTKTPLLHLWMWSATRAIAVLRLLVSATSNGSWLPWARSRNYFLIDRALYERRLDLKPAADPFRRPSSRRGWELDDHYFWPDPASGEQIHA